MKLIIESDNLKKLGVDCSVMLAILCAKREKLVDNLNDFFTFTINDLKEEYDVSERFQRRTIKTLEELGLVETKFKGLPAKKYYKVNKKNTFQPLPITIIFCEMRGCYLAGSLRRYPNKRKLL